MSPLPDMKQGVCCPDRHKNKLFGTYHLSCPSLMFDLLQNVFLSLTWQFHHHHHYYLLYCKQLYCWMCLICHVSFCPLCLCPFHFVLETEWVRLWWCRQKAILPSSIQVPWSSPTKRSVLFHRTSFSHRQIWRSDRGWFPWGEWRFRLPRFLCMNAVDRHNKQDNKQAMPPSRSAAYINVNTD